jgi:hypothetical protein
VLTEDGVVLNWIQKGNNISVGAKALKKDSATPAGVALSNNYTLN